VRTTRVIVAAGNDPEATLVAAVTGHAGLAWVASARGPIVLLCATAGARETAEQVAASIRTRGTAADVRVLVPPSGLAAGNPFRRGSWVAVDVSGRGGRFDRVRVARPVATTEVVCVVSVLGHRPERRPIAIGAFVPFLHPREGLAVRVERGKRGLAADLAIAFAPRLIVLVATVQGHAVVVSADDLIAAELVGLALRREQADDDETVGPWEDRLVQRATELNLGVRVPTAIDLVSIWTGPVDAPGVAVGTAMSERIRLRLGIPAP